MKRLLGVFDLRDGLFVVGMALVVYGLTLVYLPAAYMVPGLACIALAIWRVR